MDDERANEAKEGRRDLLRLWGPLALVTVVAFAITLRFVGAPPPDRIRLATGPESGGYAAAGERFAAALRDAGIEVDLVATRGSTENLELLREEKVDVALVQGGIARPEEPELVGLVSLYLEPLWIFATESVDRVDDLLGKPIEIGPEGSGTRALVHRLLDRAGVEVEERGGDLDAAKAAVASGEAGALARVAAPRSELVRDLLAPDSGFEPASLDRAEGIARTFPYLRRVRLYRGSIDLAGDLPRRDLDSVAAAANLVAREGLHPAVVGLLVQTAKAHFSGRGVLENPGEFPSQTLLDVEPSSVARTSLEQGPSFLYRAFPFQVAALIDRLKILILPFLTLLLPLFRLAPPLYRWRIRRRILRWYKQIMNLEHRLRAGEATDAELRSAAAELDHMDAELAQVSVPLGYADELYHLRLHLRMVREDLSSRRGRWAS
ncbi:MAG: TAXI family TRAP transporter solute-binding subunit [Planctomycetota bacterium]